MGFMAGFGPAFAKGMERNQELRENRRDDAFKFAFSEYSKNNDKINEAKKADAQAARKAKALSATKPEATPLVMEWVKAGLDDATIEKRLKTGTFSAPGAQKADTVAADPAKAPTPKPVDKQMQASGMAPAPAAAPLPTQAAPAAGDKMVSGPEEDEPAGFLSGMSGKFKRKAAPAPQASGVSPSGAGQVQTGQPQESAGPLQAVTGNTFLRDAFGNGSRSMGRFMNDAGGQIGEMTGRSAEEVRSVMQGNDPNAVEETSSGVVYTPGFEEGEASNFKNLGQAMVELEQAKAAGDPQRLANAQRVVAGYQAATTFEEERKAEAAGTIVPGAPRTILKDGQYLTTARVTKDANGVEVYAMGPQAGQPIDDGSGSVRSMPITKEERESIEKVSSELEKPSRDFSAKVANTVALYRDFADMDNIVKEQPSVLQTGASTGATWINNAINEGKAVVNLYSNTFQNAKLQDIDIAALEASEQELQTTLDNGTHDLAAAKALFDTKKAIASYRIGMSMGQEGRSLAEAERKLFGDVASAGTDPNVWRKNMSDFLEGQTKSLGIEGRNMVANSQTLKAHHTMYGYIPANINVDTVEEVIAREGQNDQRLAQGMDLVRNHANATISGVRQQVDKSAGIPQAPQAPAPDAQAAPVDITPDANGKATYDALKPGQTYRDPEGNIRTKR